jgi:hypothetical protein
VKIRLYMDEDSHRRSLVSGLRARGIEVTTPAEAGMLGEDDYDQLVWASANGLVLYSSNIGDFFQLHTEWLSSGRSHAGMVLTTQQRYSIGECIRRLGHLIVSKSAEDMIDHVEFLSDW